MRNTHNGTTDVATNTSIGNANGVLPSIAANYTYVFWWKLNDRAMDVSSGYRDVEVFVQDDTVWTPDYFLDCVGWWGDQPSFGRRSHGAATAYDSDKYPVLDRWRKYVFVSDATSLRMFCDGVKNTNSNTGAQSSAGLYEMRTMCVNTGVPDGDTGGQVKWSQWFCYDRALTDDEAIAESLNQSWFPKITEGLLSIWDFHGEDKGRIYPTWTRGGNPNNIYFNVTSGKQDNEIWPEIPSIVNPERWMPWAQLGPQYYNTLDLAGSAGLALADELIVKPWPRAVGALSATNGTSTTPTLPTHATDDILLCFSLSRGTSATLSCATSGWTGLTQVNNGTALRTRVFWKRATSSSETNPTVSNSVTQLVAAFCVSFKNCITSGSPFDNTETSGTDTTTTMTAPTITVNTVKSLLIRAHMSADDNNHGSPSEGTLGAGGTSYHTTTGLDGALSFAYLNKFTTGASGTATMTQGSNGPDNSVSWSILLKPAATGNTYNETLTLTAAGAIAGAHVGNLVNTVTLAGSAAMTFSNIANLFVSLGLSANAAAQLAGGLMIDASLGLSANATVAESGGIAVDGSVILGGSVAMALAELKTIDVNVALAAAAGLSPSANAMMIGSATLSASGALNAGAIGSFAESLNLQGAATIAPAAVLLIGAQTTLNAIAGIAAAGGTLFDATVNLPASAGLTLAELKTIDVAVNLAGSAGLAPVLAIVFQPAVGLSANATMGTQVAANMVAALNLAANGALIPLVNALIDGTLNLSAIGQFDANGQTFSGIVFDVYGRRESATKRFDPFIAAGGGVVSATESIGSMLAEKYRVKISTIIEAVRAKTK